MSDDEHNAGSPVEDSDMEEAPAAAPRRSAGRAAAANSRALSAAVAGDESDSDEEPEEEPQPKRRKAGAKGKAKPAGKAKRAPSAYMLFSQEKRPEIKAANPEATFGELGKLLGAAWRELGDDGQAPYKARADAGKPKAAAKPKSTRAPSAYMLFSQEKRPEIKAANPEATFGELGKLLGAAWRGLGDDGQAPYKEQAAAAKAGGGAKRARDE